MTYWCEECGAVFMDTMVVHQWDGHSTHEVEMLPWNWRELMNEDPDRAMPIRYESHLVTRVYLDGWYEDDQ